MSSLVSVIVPTFNGELYISETIDSILNQDYPCIEIIVIDDGSVDNTKNIIRSYGDKLRFFSQDNAGVCSARNRGIREAKGAYICFMDHDDYWFPEKISIQIEAFHEHPEVGVVFSEFLRWYPDNDGSFPPPKELQESVAGNEIDEALSGWIYHQLLLDCDVLTSAAMIRRDLFVECGCFDETLPYSEDWDLWLRFSNRFQFIKLRRTTTLYRQHLAQGSVKLRKIDYRTRLLFNAKRKWGLCSRDGRCLTEWQFRRQLAEYHAEFALHHLYYNGHFSLAVYSLLKAWLSFPFRLGYLAYLMAAFLGWKPRWQ